LTRSRRIALDRQWPEALTICVGAPLIPLLLAVDAVHLVLRLCLCPLAVAVWWLERRMVLWLGRTCVCPVATGPGSEPRILEDGGDGMLHLFLDSLDECLLRIDTLACLLSDPSGVQGSFLPWRTSPAC
jgi:hypothetical protein